MNCQNCGTFNNEGSKFCIKCGQNISGEQQPNVVAQDIPSQNMNVNNEVIQNNVQPNVNVNQNFNSVNTNNVNEDTKVSIMGFLFTIIAVILKPFTTFKEELNKFNNFKNSAILSLIVSGFATIVTLITSMLNVVKEKSFDWSAGGYKTTWAWENLKELNYIEVIGKNFLIYLGVIVAIAGVYYLASLVIKKQTNISRLLGISALSVAPMLICSLILSPILSMIYAPLGMGITIIGAVYTIIILYETINNEILLDGNVKIYFNLICLSILGIAAYYLYMKIFMSSISGELNDIMDLFG